MTDDPVQHYIPPSPYIQPQPHQPPPKKGMSTAAIVILIIVVMVVIGIIAVAVMFAMVSNIGGEPWEETRNFETEVHIEDGGHFRYLLSNTWEDEMVVNFTIGHINGSSYDVYIMDGGQYDNAYGNQSTGAFSAMFSWQDVSNVMGSAVIDSPEGPYYLVVDNVDMSHVPGSATPDGPIHVEVDLDITSRFEDVW